MTRALIVSACLVCATVGTLYAQAPARDAAQALAPPSGTGLIGGTVKNLKGEPVRRATVLITGDMRLERRTVTSNDGHFVFDSLPQGRFTVSAEKPGYPRMSYGAKRPYRNGGGVFLEEGEQVADLTLTLSPGAVLTGVVRDEHGQPLPGVPVMAWQIRDALNGARTLDYALSEPVTITTDDVGRYRAYGLPPGTYTVGTTWYYTGQGFDVRLPSDAEFTAAFPAPGQSAPTARPGTPQAPAPPRYNYAPVFAPGVTDPLSAATYTLAAGEIREGVDLQMRFEQTSRIEGTVVNPGGPPMAVGLTVTRRSPVQALNISQVSGTAPDGRFATSSLSPGQYTLIATSRPSDAQQLWATADVFLSSGEPSVVTMTLAPALTVTGRVVFEGSTLPPPKDVTRLSVALFDVGPTRSRTTTTIDADGVVSISGVMPGRYMVRASVPPAAMANPPAAGAPAWLLGSVTIGDRDVTDQAVDVTAGGASELTITFIERLSELSGTVTNPDGTPATDYFVIAMPPDKDMWIPLSRRIVSTRPDRAGRYTFRNLPAGDYRIAVTTDLVAQDLQDVATLGALMEQSLPVTLALGERRTLDVRTTGGQQDY